MYMYTHAFIHIHMYIHIYIHVYDEYLTIYIYINKTTVHDGSWGCTRISWEGTSSSWSLRSIRDMAGAFSLICLLHNWLVVWNMNLYLSIYGEYNNPNWRTHMFHRGSNHQPVSVCDHMGETISSYKLWSSTIAEFKDEFRFCPALPMRCCFFCVVYMLVFAPINCR